MFLLLYSPVPDESFKSLTLFSVSLICWQTQTVSAVKYDPDYTCIVPGFGLIAQVPKPPV